MSALCYRKKGASLNVLEMFHLAMTPIMTSCFLLTARVFWSVDSKQFSLHSLKCSGIFWVLWIGVEDRKSNPKNGGHRKSSVLNRLRTISGSHSLPSATRQARKSYTVWVSRVPPAVWGDQHAYGSVSGSMAQHRDHSPRDCSPHNPIVVGSASFKNWTAFYKLVDFT